MCWIVRCRWLTFDPKNCTNSLAILVCDFGQIESLLASVSRNVCSRRVNDMREINCWKKVFDQLLSELSLHERIGRDHAQRSPAPDCHRTNAKSKNRSVNGTAK